MPEAAELCLPGRGRVRVGVVPTVTEGDRSSVLATQTFTNPLNQMVKHFQTRLLFSTFEVRPWNACEVWLTCAGSAAPLRICSSSCTDSIKTLWIWYSPKHPTSLSLFHKNEPHFSVASLTTNSSEVTGRKKSKFKK